MNSYSSLRQRGLTLIELTVVMMILVALAGLAIPYLGGTSRFAQCASTDTSMRAIRDAIIGAFEEPGYQDDVGALPSNLDDLFNKPASHCPGDTSLTTAAACTAAGHTWEAIAAFNPVTRRGWHGPYLLTPTYSDAYHNVPIRLVIPDVDADGNDCSDMGYDKKQCARLESAGADGIFNEDNFGNQTSLADANGSNRGDDRYFYLFIPDPNPGLPCNET